MHSDRVAALFVGMALLASPIFAQQSHVVDPTAIDEALSEHVAREEADREAISRFLQREDVRAIASKSKVDLSRVEAAVRTLEGEDLARISSMAREVEDGLAGGGNITISTTTIIIALLVLILLIVAI
jgi:hypothetical protein